MAEQIALVASSNFQWTVLEIFSGSEQVSKCAGECEEWRALEPIDVLTGHDLTQPRVQQEVLRRIREQAPDLVALAPPCGPWSGLPRLAPDPRKVRQKREADMPLWRFTAEVWHLQHQAGRLVITEQVRKLCHCHA